MELHSRRKFLKSGLLGITGTTLLSGSHGGEDQPKKGSDKNTIIYRTLGKTGIRVPARYLKVLRGGK